MPALEKIDWVAIEKEYVQGSYTIAPDGKKEFTYPTLDELAEKYNCSRSRVGAKSSQEKWLNRRELYKEKLRLHVISQGESINLCDSTRYDTENLTRLENLGILIDDWIEERLVADEEGNRRRVDAKELNLIMDALAKKHQLARNIFGEPIGAEKGKETKIEQLQINRKEINLTDISTIKKVAQILSQKEEKLKLLKEQEKILEIKAQKIGES
jgi:predicted DNA-binding protein YlxM (UPF0122 family)